MKFNPLSQNSKGFSARKPISALLAFALLFSSCSHKIIRQGYQAPASDGVPCNVTIRKHMDADLEAEPKGEVQLADSGVSLKCDEMAARRILAKEACAVGANFVHIHKEKRPDLWSSCYRCSATLYLVDSASEDLDQSYLADTVNPYAPETTEEKNSVALQVIGGILGFAAGYVLGYWLFGGFD